MALRILNLGQPKQTVLNQFLKIREGTVEEMLSLE